MDFSARTVITGDPHLDLDQVGVPLSIAMRLTYPERVTPHNLAQMRRAVGVGPDALGGALYVERTDGERFDLAFVSLAATSAKLRVGDVVDRMLRDDDIVVMNRQPSLHKMSMMAHRVKILLYSTFRLNLSVTTPYNAASREEVDVPRNPEGSLRVAGIGPRQHRQPVEPAFLEPLCPGALPDLAVVPRVVPRQAIAK